MTYSYYSFKLEFHGSNYINNRSNLNFIVQSYIIKLSKEFDMEKEELTQLITSISNRKYESQIEECKAARKGCPEHLYDTLSSFSNQDQGGVIIFGIDEKNNYELCGVYNVSDLQLKLQNQCENMLPAVRAFFTPVSIDSKDFLAMEIPGINPLQRPCFYKPKGKYSGSYVRVGDADIVMNEFEIYQYESYKKRIKDDIRTIEDSDIKLFDVEKHDKYLKLVKEKRQNLSKNVSDKEIDVLMGLRVNNKPTLAATITFSKYPQTYFPQYCINAVRINGTTMTDLGIDGERFVDSEKITGPIDDMAEELVKFVLRNMNKKTLINNFGQRNDKPEYPIIAIREAIINALIHRDYSIFSEGMPIRVEMYNDRIEIINPGQIYGGGRVELLGHNRFDTRNPVLTDILEILEITENRYSGIPTIRKEMRENNLPQPIFISQRGEFKVVLRNTFVDDEENVIKSIINYCSIPRSREEIVKFVGKSKNHVISKYISPLVASGQLKLSIPDKPQSPYQKYFS